MELISVESSNIAAIGYAEEYGLLRVQFKDGAVYDYAGVSAERYAMLMAANSKGHCLRSNFSNGTRIDSKPIGKPKPQPELNRTLQSHVEDECCDGPLSRALRAGSLDTAESWTCPKCGEVWKVWLIEEGIRYWSPRPIIMIL